MLILEQEKFCFDIIEIENDRLLIIEASLDNGLGNLEEIFELLKDNATEMREAFTELMNTHERYGGARSSRAMASSYLPDKGPG